MNDRVEFGVVRESSRDFWNSKNNPQSRNLLLRWQPWPVSQPRCWKRSVTANEMWLSGGRTEDSEVSNSARLGVCTWLCSSFHCYSRLIFGKGYYLFKKNSGCRIMFHGTIVTFCDFTQIRGVWSVQITDQRCSVPPSLFTDYTQAMLQSEPPLQNAQNKGFKKMLIRWYQLW